MSYLPINRKYLLRFDDICPAMNWRIWPEIEAVLTEHDLRPMLAVVPDNRDPVLEVDAPAADFWDRVREWQARGWTIALHGYQHRYVTCHRGVVTPKRKSEFAGLPAREQAEKLRRGVEIFEREGVHTRLWIAPSHSFDRVTLSLLPRFGINMISDGYCRYPFVDRANLFWIPQQLSYFRPAPPGVWTVCHHHNHWTAAQVSRFREDIARYRRDITSVERVVGEWGARRSYWSGLACRRVRLSPLMIRCALKIWSWWRRSSPEPEAIPVAT
jgi:peptidoglycan/xylan/chitin deacetylase (PgdA/CDA1 family)